MKSLFVDFIKLTAWPVAWIAFHTKCYFEDKRVQGRRIRGKAIVASNHRSIWDLAVMMFVFPFRTLRCVIAEVMFQKNFIFSWFLYAIGGIRVDRKSNDYAFINKCKRVLSRGGVVEIYPESRLPLPDEERPLEFKPSVIYLALESGAPIIPVYTNGNCFRKARNKVMIGKPFYVLDHYDGELSEKENIANITQLLRQRIIELGNELEKREKEEGCQ